MIKLETATTDVRQSFEDVRDKIADAVFNQKRRGEVHKYLQRVRAEALIEWKNDDLRRMYERKIKSMAETPVPGA